MTQTTIDRRTVLAAIAAVPAAAVLTTPALAEVGVVAELRQLWAKYLVQLEVHDKAHAVVEARRDAFDAVCPKGVDGIGDFHNPEYAALWKKHGLHLLYRNWNRESDKLKAITKAIRKAKAESMFGIGVSVFEDPSSPCDYDFAEAIDDARAALADLTEVDFIGARGGLRYEAAQPVNRGAPCRLGRIRGRG